MSKAIKNLDQFTELMKQFEFDYFVFESKEWITFVFNHFDYSIWNDETKELTIQTKEDSRTIPIKAKHRLIHTILDDGTIRFEIIFKHP